MLNILIIIYNVTAEEELILDKKDLNDFRVTYKNVFNEVAIANLSENESNLLMTIVSRLDRKDEAAVVIPFKDLPEIVNSDLDGRPEKIVTLIDSLWDKIKNVDYKLYAGKQAAGGVLLFSYLSANKDKQEVEVKINPDLKYFVNDFEQGKYSSLDYRDFKQTADKYGKLLFRQLNQWKFVHDKEFDLDKLAYLLDTAPAYRTSGSKFTARVLKPAIKSIMPLMEYLEYTPIFTGRKITSYKFHFKFKNGPDIERKEIEAEEEENIVNKQRQIKTEIEQAKPQYENNFKNGYIPGKNSPTIKYIEWLESVKFFSSNSEYFQMRTEARRVLQTLYKERVIDNDSPMWTDMTFLAAAIQLISHNRQMVGFQLENSYAELQSGRSPLEISADIYDSLPLDKAKQLFSFAMCLPEESVEKRDIPTTNYNY